MRQHRPSRCDSTVVAHLDPRRRDSYGAAVAARDATRPTEDCPMTTPDATIDPTTLQATVEQVFGSLGGAVIASMIYLGDHLGVYRALPDAGDAMTSDEFAIGTGLDERWLREWLRWQVALRLVDYPGVGPTTSRIR
jgi:hypothetical protein